MSATRQNKEALYVQDNTKNIVTNLVDEKVLMEENATRVRTSTYGDSWIVGSSTNGIVGTNTGTQGGGQQVVGGSGRVEAVVRVVSPNNIFRERFRHDRFEDTGTTTADWADTVGTIVFTTGEIAQSLSIFLNNFTLTKATMIATASSGDVSDLAFQLSADGGSNWENITLGTEHTFTNTGNDLRFKITASGSVTLTNVQIEYS